MLSKIAPSTESLSARFTIVQILAGVIAAMNGQIVRIAKALTAKFAGVRLLAGVD